MSSTSQLIILNGTSCSGKSTLAEHLTDKISGGASHFTWDSFLELLPSDKTATDEEKSDLVKLFTKKACERLDNGENLILDIVCVPANTFERLLNEFNAYAPLTIRVRASVPTLRAREALRPDRTNGQAENQNRDMYENENHPPYAIELDSTALSVEQEAQIILKKLNCKSTPSLN
jgi:chloramphenicol 3-O phosphotransferase